MDVVVDTHPFIFWLLSPEKLGKKSIKILEDSKSKLFVPAMVILEIQYLIEINRIKGAISDYIKYIASSENFQLLDLNREVLLEAVNLRDHRDPFDRTILASAMSLSIPIISRDRWMKESYKKVIW